MCPTDVEVSMCVGGGGAALVVRTAALSEAARSSDELVPSRAPDDGASGREPSDLEV